MKLGIFTKYNDKKDRFDHYHGSPCKILKIIDEMQKLIKFKYYINNYNLKFDYAIVDRIKPAEKIRSKNILGIFEMKIKRGYATKFCSISPAIKIKTDDHFHLLNYCHGKKIKIENLARSRSKKGVFLGRLDKMCELKIKILGQNNFNLDIFPTKYWGKGEILRFHDGARNSEKNKEFVQSILPKCKILNPVTHNYLYSTLNDNKYAYGFVPSVYKMHPRITQPESSSKFFEYIGAGIPVLIESRVPEARLVKRNPFLGEVYSNEESLIVSANKLLNNKYNYKRILRFAHRNHYPSSRAMTIYNNFINN